MRIIVVACASRETAHVFCSFFCQFSSYTPKPQLHCHPRETVPLSSTRLLFYPFVQVVYVCKPPSRPKLLPKTLSVFLPFVSSPTEKSGTQQRLKKIGTKLNDERAFTVALG